MRGTSRRIAIGALLATAWCLRPAPTHAGDRYAMLVGVRQYIKSELTPLKFTENDIDGLSQVLRQAGYPPENLIVMTQTAGNEDARYSPTAENIQRELKLLLAEPTADDTVLVALSGHGVQFQGEKDVYFCPADARLKDRDTLLSLDTVYKALESCQAASKVLLVDACRNDPQSNLGKAAGEVQLEPVGRRAQPAAPPGGIAALFSCAAGQKSFEIPDLEHGVFFHFVIEGLAGKADSDGDQEVTLPELEQFAGKRVKNYVRNQLSELQTPERRGESRGLVTLTRVADVFAGTRAGQERSDNGLMLRLCWCPPGKFIMGSPPGEPDRANDEAETPVTLTRGFWLGKFEVTQGQWESVMGTTATEQRALARGAKLYGMGPDHPMYYVNHDEATQFCLKLTASERAAGRLSARTEYRLPTEAQWEYGCRAGTTTATAFGETLSSTQANFNGHFPYNGGARGPDLQQTVEVGKYAANAWGLCDMDGNVMEWCRDWHGAGLPGGNDPEVTIPTSNREYRGGSFASVGKNCRAALRGGCDPRTRHGNLGFRVALVQTGM
jgi:formylglycine-generating enzyme required for sulfatase activity